MGDIELDVGDIGKNGDGLLLGCDVWREYGYGWYSGLEVVCMGWR